MYIAKVGALYVSNIKGLDVLFDDDGRAIPEVEGIILCSNPDNALPLYPSDFGDLDVLFSDVAFYEKETMKKLTYKDFKRLGI